MDKDTLKVFEILFEAKKEGINFFFTGFKNRGVKNWRNISSYNENYDLLIQSGINEEALSLIVNEEANINRNFEIKGSSLMVGITDKGISAYKDMLASKETKIEEKQIETEANFDKNTISIVLKNEVFSHIKELLNGGHYFNAVEEAYKIVRAKLKSITGKEKAHEGFKEDNYELIFGHAPADDTEKDFFEGVKFLHMSIQKLRNEKAHKPAEDIDKNLAIHYIVLASLAYDLIDR